MAGDLKQFNSLAVVNCELTSRCNKRCFMCGRRRIEKDYPHLANWGDMDFKLVEKIAKQLPDGIVVQLHNNGESLLYPKFGEAAKLFHQQIRCLDTNGKLIVEKAKEIIGNLDTLTISVIENDPEAEEQYKLVKKFLKIKGNRKPNLIYRCLGKVNLERWKKNARYCGYQSAASSSWQFSVSEKTNNSGNRNMFRYVKPYGY